MDAMEALMTRRSIRSFTDKDVSKELEEKVLRAGMAAPSAGNEQPWHFVVVRDKATLMRIAEVHPHAGMLKEAALGIIVAGEKSLEAHEGMMAQDLSAAAQNILLACHAEGLGAVWCGVHPRPEREEGIRKVLGLPEGVVPFCVIPVGFPKTRPGLSDRYRPDRIHREKW